MQSVLPKVGDTYLDEELINDLVEMWSTKESLSEETVKTLRRQLTNLQYDAETIRTWKNLLAQWRG